MPLGTDYAGQACSLARTLEIVGERWTLLILRDLFFGVRRFSDLQRHLDIPRAVLSARIASLVERGLVERRPYAPGRDELLLTEAGVDLWPAVHALMQWGEKHRSPGGARRVFVHVDCGTAIGPSGGALPASASRPPPSSMRPGPGAGAPIRDDAVTLALREPRRLLTPLPGAPLVQQRLRRPGVGRSPWKTLAPRGQELDRLEALAARRPVGEREDLLAPALADRAEAHGQLVEDQLALVAGANDAPASIRRTISQRMSCARSSGRPDQDELGMAVAVRKADGVGEADVVDRVRAEARLLGRMLRMVLGPHVHRVEPELADVGEHLVVAGVASASGGACGTRGVA